MVAVRLGMLQETMLVTLWARAWDAERKTPLLGDTYAKAIVAALDFDFTRFMGSIGTRFGVTVRATVLEAEVRALLERFPDALVVELGVGLSSRFERLDNGRARFIELDLPDAIALRRHFFEDGARRQMIAASVLEAGWLEPVREAARGRPLVFVAEGVLPYFYDGDVRRLLRSLSTSFPDAYFVFDSTSPDVVAQHQQLRTLKGTRARFSWGLAHPEELPGLAGAGCLCSSVSLRAMLKQAQGALPLSLRLSFPVIDKLRPRMLDGYRVNVLSFADRPGQRVAVQGAEALATRPQLART